MKHFKTINDFSRDDLEFLLHFTHRVKSHPEVYGDRLQSKTLGLIFEKPSTRTWVSFQVGMTQLGGKVLYLGPTDIQLGKREEIRDIARVLSGYMDAFVLRTFSHRTITEFARYSSKPVVNGLSDFAHPCQAMTDLFTIREHFSEEAMKKIKVVYVGDANNVMSSLLLLFAKLGLNIQCSTPKEYAPSKKVLNAVKSLSRKSKARVVWTPNVKQAVRGADVLYTDVWVSMGEKTDSRKKKKVLKPYQINQKLLRLASKDVKVMHCLPAHRGEEITNQVMEGRHSLIFQQAGNRLPVQQSILLHLMGEI